MDLLKYLEPMKNIPERFSNLAFWRGVRKLRDEVVNAFEYVDSWGKNIEHSIDSVPYHNEFPYLYIKNQRADQLATRIDIAATVVRHSYDGNNVKDTFTIELNAGNHSLVLPPVKYENFYIKNMYLYIRLSPTDTTTIIKTWKFPVSVNLKNINVDASGNVVSITISSVTEVVTMPGIDKDLSTPDRSIYAFLCIESLWSR